MPITPGTRLGPYEVTALVGAGGMGEVYKARDTRLERTVAIKVLPPELAADPDRRARFEREARAISHLNHPYICTLFDVGREGGTDFLVMEYLEGETAASVAAAILDREPEPVTALQPLTPPAFEHVVATCLAKDPEARWQAAGDVARQLRWIAKSGTGPIPSVAADRPRINKRFVARALVGIALAAALVAAGFLLASRRTERRSASPSFTRLTFQRGRVENARFTPDGKSVFYSAAWDGRLPDVFETRTDRSSTRSLGLSGTRLHAVSRSGELAVENRATSGLGEYGSAHGPLAVLTLSGGAPRDLVEDVSAADWAPDGKTLAVVRRIGSEDRLEMPQGHVLVRTSGWLRDIRVSPDGSRVAFVEHPQFHDSRGSVAFADGTGRKTMLTEEYGSVQGVAWSPDGREIWFSAAAVGTRQGLFAVTPLYRGPRLDVFGIDVESGRRRLWRTFEAPDPAGVGVATFIVTRDARSYAYVYERLLDELYLVEGLK